MKLKAYFNKSEQVYLRSGLLRGSNTVTAQEFAPYKDRNLCELNLDGVAALWLHFSVWFLKLLLFT
jgi:hypothetical protein